MLSTSGSNSGARPGPGLEVNLDLDVCPELPDLAQAQLSSGLNPALLCCTNAQGETQVKSLGDQKRDTNILTNSCTHFLWESGYCLKPKLLLMDSEFALRVYDVETEDQLTLLCDLPSHELLEGIQDRYPDVESVDSLRALSFSESLCVLLLNSRLLLQLRVTQTLSLETLSCYPLSEVGQMADECVDCCLCRGLLFILLRTGLAYVFDSSDGQLIARVDFISYCSDPDFASTSSSFSLLQVSQDLSTAVSITLARQAVAIDLNHYFSAHPDHLCSSSALSHSYLKPSASWDLDGLSSSAHSLSVIERALQTDRSWDSRLSLLYRQIKAKVHSTFNSPWYKAAKHIECHRVAVVSQMSCSYLKPGGAVMSFNVPDGALPAGLNVTEFSVLVRFTCPANVNTVLAYWDFKDKGVAYHHEETNAVPVQRASEENLALLLKASGLSLVLFRVTQDELLNRLMIFGSAGMVDSLCHLNTWGRCSIPIHALQAGLKNHQLDTVEFFLKSKENLLSSASGFTCTLTHLRSVQALCPALDLLRSSIRDTLTEAQSQQFSEQLLSITLRFLHTQIRFLLSTAQELDEHLQECVRILQSFISDLRVFLKRFPWLESDGETAASGQTPAPEASPHWHSLSDEEVVYEAVLSSRIPDAQAFLRSRGSKHTLEDVRRIILMHTHSLLKKRELQEAQNLLSNMGFNVKEQLHNICVFTEDQDLRTFMVEELQKMSFLSAEELQQVQFIQTIANLCSEPATRCCKPLQSHSFLSRSADSQSRRLLHQLLHDSSPSTSSLLDCVRLHWVRHWDVEAQKQILLSRLALTSEGSWDAAQLWSYLTSLNDSDRCFSWLNSTSPSASVGDGETVNPWPDLAPQIINSSSQCGENLLNRILDVLARQGLFVPSEMEDFQQLLWRMAQAGGVMYDGRDPPLPNFHHRFIVHCLENSLQYMLYTYLEHYRLTPEHCALLGDRTAFESFPWFNMMLKLQKIPRNLQDPECVFEASLTSAQVLLLRGGQASVSSVLLEGHTLLALATVMFRAGGIHQAVCEHELDSQLLRMALGVYPKLKSALFPQSNPRADLTLYQLIQTSNTVNSSCGETSSELPHFSSAALVSRYAPVENLDFLYYLRQGRPAVAYCVFLTQHLIDCNNIKIQLCVAAQQAYALALLHFSSTSVCSACVCFCELLGVCSLKLRTDVRSLNLIYADSAQSSPDHEPITHSLVEKASELLSAEQRVAAELLPHLEAAVRDVQEKDAVSSWQEVTQDWSLPVLFSHLHGLPLSPALPLLCARDGQWLHFLLFVQMHKFPPQQCHLSLALEDPGSTPDLPRDESPTSPREIFQMLLWSQESHRAWKILLSESIRQHCPLLSVLAACHQGAELLQCLCVWILTSMEEDDVTREATAHIDESPAHHLWSLHDLSIIWKTLLARGKIRPLIRGFHLYQRESPLISMLQMYEFCSDYKDYHRAKEKLLDFQKALLNCRSSSVVLSSDSLPVPWIESQASVLLLMLLKQSSTQFELRRLLQLLVDVEKLLKSNGPDFRSLSALSQILSETPLSFPSTLLEAFSPEVFQTESRRLMEELQNIGLFKAARELATLAQLPLDALITTQLLQDLSVQQQKRQWERLDTRLAFWSKSHDQLSTNHVLPETSCRFFLSQAEGALDSDPELLILQERCVLLALAAHWLSLCSPASVSLRLADLEKRQWEFRIQWQMLDEALERQSLFASSDPCEDSVEKLLRQFSFSKIMDDPSVLSLDGLPVEGDECSLSEDEQRVLEGLIGKLLDSGSVCEASRVCRYFSLFQKDVWLVLKCRGLACGEIQPELQSPQGETRHSLTSSPSVSSLSSFVVLSSPEDAVELLIKQLLDQSDRGKSFCQQLLCLYQLAKELQCPFSDLSLDPPPLILRKVLLSLSAPLLERCRKAQFFISVHGLPPDTVAEIISTGVMEGLIASARDPENFVELLILAHDCFSVSCNMEGIVRVLQASRVLSHTHLTHGDTHGLLVRLLTGIGRYSDMTYLKTALLDYIKRCLPGDSEKYNMVALCFSMCREIGENHEAAARTQLKIIESKPWVVTAELKSSLTKVLTLLKDAAESYSKDHCMRQAVRCVKLSKLVMLQLHFLNQGLEESIINLQPQKIQSIIASLPRCYQALVVCEAYEFSPDWSELLYQKVILQADFTYLEEFKRHRTLTSSLFQEISDKVSLLKPPASSSQNLKKLLSHCECVYTHYKLAYEHQFLDVANTLLQDSRTNSFLNDRLGT
ncbi:hypothetical protein DNTS_027858 [Danionella cerebrum]|uniref:Spatacsin C-terminal domain-containing protein n=1 Tax=Danionella cerebrum TaxID=2873325 RepID=A0A553R9J3_9TELE|nr:hypothetical protein DNTS_027858 [Danionella translucida]